MSDQQKVVLIIEDSISIRKKARAVLSKANISVREAGSEIGMLNTIEQYGKCADLVIMDLTLRAEHGFDLIKTLKDSPKYKEIPILILTQHADVNSVLTAKKLGVDGYMKKPIESDELLKKVQSLLYVEEN